MFKVNNTNTRTRYEICSELKIKTSERRHWRHSSVVIVKFEQILHLALVFLLSLVIESTRNNKMHPTFCLLH